MVRESARMSDIEAGYRMLTTATRSPLRERAGWPRVLWIVGAVLLAAMVFHIVALATGGIGLAMTLLLINAFRSRPLDRLDPASLVVLALCAVALITVYVRLAAARLRPPG